jgi:acetoacetyl-CoA synthetase
MSEETPPILWEPPAELAERAQMTRYRRWLERERGMELPDYHAMWRWSVQDLEGFWRSIWDYFGVQSPEPPDAVLADRSMPGARWFEGTRVNYAEHMLRGKPDDRVAILHASESRELAEMTWGELR